MKAEKFSDALNFLDEELLEEADSLRGRSRFHIGWKGWTAAACAAVVLSAGFWVFSQSEVFTPAPIEGSSETSQPGTLPLLTISQEESAMGYEGYMAYSADELINGNPWQEGMELTTLPVYKNALSYTQGYIPQGVDLEKMEEILREAAGCLGLDPDALGITNNVPDEEKQKKIIEKLTIGGGEVPEGYFDPTELIVEGEGVKLTVSADLTLQIEFDPGRALPAGMDFGYHAPLREMDAAADYFLEEYTALIPMERPQKDISGGDYNIYKEQSYRISFFEDSKDITERIINYNFNKIFFYPNESKELNLVRACRLNGEKLGDYPIISLEEAKALLAENHFITTVPYEMPGIEYVAKAELLYRTGREEIYMPYYRFLVEIPEAEREGGMKSYGAYYVPAVAGEYLTNMPTWNGSFNY